MQSFHVIRGVAEDPHWPDRDRVLAAPDAPALAGGMALALAGPPGLAFGAALGLALAERLLTARFGRSLVDHRTWLVAGAAELAAGTSHEAAAVAGALSLGRLTVIAALPLAEGAALSRFGAVGWGVRRVAAGDLAELEAAISAAQRAQKPTLIAMLHRGAAPDGGRAALAASAQSAGARRAWLKRLRRHAAAPAFQQAVAAAPAPRLAGALPLSEAGAEATPLEAAQEALARLAPVLPDLVTLPAPVGAAPGTAAAEALWAGRHQAQAAAQLGMALHGGMLPLGWFPPEAADTLLPARRAAAAYNVRLVQVVTGDAGGGDALDGAGGRAFRPCGAAEALECTALALRWPGPAVLLLHDSEAVKTAPGGACARGGYRIAGSADAACTLLAAGRQVALALRVQAALAAGGTDANVVSVPCESLFAAQDAAWRDGVTGSVRLFGLGCGRTLPRCEALDHDGEADAARLAARIEHRLRRSSDILEVSVSLLESAAKLD